MLGWNRRVRGNVVWAWAAVLLIAGSSQAGIVIEDFEAGNLDAYTFVGTTDANVASQYAHDGDFGLGITGSGWIYRDDAAVQLQQGDTFSVWVQFVDVANERAYFGFGASEAGTLSFVLAPNTGDIRFQENPDYGFTQLDSSEQTFLADTWYRAEVEWGLGGDLTGRLYDSDGTTLLNTVTSSSTLFTSGGIAFRGFGGVKAFDTVVLQAEPPVVPEPSTLATGGLAVLLSLLIARRRSLASRQAI